MCTWLRPPSSTLIESLAHVLHHLLVHTIVGKTIGISTPELFLKSCYSCCLVCRFGRNWCCRWCRLDDDDHFLPLPRLFVSCERKAPSGQARERVDRHPFSLAVSPQQDGRDHERGEGSDCESHRPPCVANRCPSNHRRAWAYGRWREDAGYTIVGGGVRDVE